MSSILSYVRYVVLGGLFRGCDKKSENVVAPQRKENVQTVALGNGVLHVGRKRPSPFRKSV